MKRREFIGLIGCATAAPILATLAQPREKLLRIGVLNSFVRTNLVAEEWDRAFRQRLVELGLIDGRTVHLEYRWGDGSIDRMQTLAKELVELKPDVLVAMTTPATAALQAATRTIPIVFAAVSDPVGNGFAASLAKPGGNITGFVDIEGSLGGKWLELIHGIAPSAFRVAFLFNPQTAPFTGYYLDTFRSSAAALNIEPIESAVHAAAEVEAAMTKLGREGGVGIIVMPETSTGDYGEAIISLADRYLLPTIYPFSVFVAAGGLMSYGVNYPDLLRDTASYVDRIIEGATPHELPVQLPTKFELMINLKAAKALGLSVPQTLLVAADKVVE